VSAFGLAAPVPVLARGPVPRAGVVAAPENVPGLAAKVKSWRVETGWLPGHWKKAGANSEIVTLMTELAPAGVVTINSATPGGTSGTRRFNCVGLMK